MLPSGGRWARGSTECPREPARGRSPPVDDIRCVKTGLTGHHQRRRESVKDPGVTMMAATTMPDIELALPARAANIAVVRHAFGAIGEAFEVDEETLSNIRLAVTEACTNVVVHAYPGD